MNFLLIKKRIIAAVIFGILITAGIGIYSDFGKMTASLGRFNLWYLPLILLMAPSNYFFRFIKWNYYLRILNIEVERKDNIKIFLSGLCMTLTPGKAGEFLKSYLIKEFKDIPVSVTFPVVIMERLTDGISMLILAGIGTLQFKYGAGILLAAALLAVSFVLFIRFKAFAYIVIGFLKKLPLLKKVGSGIEVFYNSSYKLLGTTSILTAVGIGLVSWSFEGIAVYLILMAFNVSIPVLSSIFIISFSTIAGALSMLPGGLLVMEGSIMGLLVIFGVSKDIASLTTVFTRFATLWLGVLVGIAALAAVQRKLGGSPKESLEGCTEECPKEIP